ncbi:hypothetical protein ANANG_G00311680 [Anguilla anguilla]|uniref:Secreted protein n=1 Tax=Anguilla anguilla TaxID=7936 RepID=A0A9D3RHM3_ANGAN|nr:hypothetical protein ANANG_G00311680 [Anguilla anguilla]
MRGRSIFLLVVYALFQLEIAGCFSGDHGGFASAQERERRRWRSQWHLQERGFGFGPGRRGRHGAPSTTCPVPGSASCTPPPPPPPPTQRRGPTSARPPESWASASWPKPGMRWSWRTPRSQPST